MPCDIELIMDACQAAYRIRGNDIDDTQATGLAASLQTKKEINNKGYNVSACLSESVSGLNAVCLVPEDSSDPIIISYRGTKTAQDAWSNVLIAAKGLAAKKLRDEAYQFFCKINEHYPDRTILLTGHSLGGNLAQDVALRVCLERKEYPLVRTINTAPIHDAAYDKLYQDQPVLKDNIVNYRLTGDVISKKAINQCYGDIYQFDGGKYKNGAISSHMIYAMREVLPPNIKSLKISGSPSDRFLETLHGVCHSYESRVNGRWYRKLTYGPGNLAKLKKLSEEITPLIQQGKKIDAAWKIHTLQVTGQEANDMLKILQQESRRLLSPAQQLAMPEKKDVWYILKQYKKYISNMFFSSEKNCDLTMGIDDEKTSKLDSNEDTHRMMSSN